MTLAELASRVEALEKTVEALKSSAVHPPISGRWWVEYAGRFESDPLFEEAVRLGREYRESQKPAKKSKSGRKK